MPRLRLVGPDDMRRPTPCSTWDVRALVDMSSAPTFAGRLVHRLARHPNITQEA